MEIIAKITNIGAITERKYTNNQTGMEDTFKTLGLTLQRGDDWIYAEAVQELATKIVEMQTQNDMQGGLVFVRISSTIRTFKDKNNVERYRTEHCLVLK